MQQYVRQLPALAEGEAAGCVCCSSSCGGNPAEPASSRQAPHPHTAGGCLAQEPGPVLASPSFPPQLLGLPPPVEPKVLVDQCLLLKGCLLA